MYHELKLGVEASRKWHCRFYPGPWRGINSVRVGTRTMWLWHQAGHLKICELWQGWRCSRDLEGPRAEHHTQQWSPQVNRAKSWWPCWLRGRERLCASTSPGRAIVPPRVAWWQLCTQGPEWRALRLQTGAQWEGQSPGNGPKGGKVPRRHCPGPLCSGRGRR